MAERLKRPMESMPKGYKINQKQIKKLLSDIEAGKYNDGMRKLEVEIPCLFVLDEEHANLPDMTLEELKMVFPYYFDDICLGFGWHEERISLEKFQEIYALSTKKRIPFILGEKYEYQRFHAKENIQGLMNQVDPKLMESYMPMILQAGMFPGVDLEDMKIQTLDQLIQMWKHYHDILLNLIVKMCWYGADRTRLHQISKGAVYQETEVEVEWKLIELLQVRLKDWERRNPLSEEEEIAMNTLADFVKRREWDAEIEKNLRFLFDGDEYKTVQFLEKNKKNISSLIFDKPVLYKVVCMAGRTVLDHEENGKRLMYLMKMEEQG